MAEADGSEVGELAVPCARLTRGTGPLPVSCCSFHGNTFDSNTVCVFATYIRVSAACLQGTGAAPTWRARTGEKCTRHVGVLQMFRWQTRARAVMAITRGADVQ